jgi:cysteine-rich repeat protein
MRRTRIFPLARTAAGLAAAVLLASSDVQAADLLAGKSLTLRDSPDPRRDSAAFTYSKDPGLFSLADPTCAASNATTIQLVTSAGAGPLVTLPCAGWKFSGGGFRYSAKAGGPGGVRSVSLRTGSMSFRAAGPPYSAIGGPVSWVETRFKIGSTLYCGRFAQPPGKLTRNVASGVSAKGPTAPCQFTCGNGILEDGEACDDHNLVSGDGCDANCTVTACGNGIVTAGEECDDHNLVGGDGCRANCTLEVCGDGILDPGEDCDDGNTVDGDCCSSSCKFETGACTDHDGCTTGDVCNHGVCAGTRLKPWINEIDYDDYAVPLNGDRDEFVELAGPAGTDLSGYQIISVEGRGPEQCFGTGNANAGYANFATTIPNGSVLGHDTGGGIGYFVACFTNTSTNVVASGKCDAVLPAPFSDSNLQNGHLTNADNFSCPDGLLVLDSDDDFVDAVSYEGIVPNVGPYGPFFHITTPYQIPMDQGWLKGVSIEKTSSTLARATAASEWRDPSELGGIICQGQIGLLCPTDTATPGTANPTQTLACGSPCAAFLDVAEDLIP